MKKTGIQALKKVKMVIKLRYTNISIDFSVDSRKSLGPNLFEREYRASSLPSGNLDA
jgi:hypothetical protein